MDPTVHYSTLVLVPVEGRSIDWNDLVGVAAA